MAAAADKKIARLEAFLGAASADMTFKLAEAAGVFKLCDTLVCDEATPTKDRRGRFTRRALIRFWELISKSYASEEAVNALQLFSAQATNLSEIDPRTAILELQQKGGREVLSALKASVSSVATSDVSSDELRAIASLCALEPHASELVSNAERLELVDPRALGDAIEGRLRHCEDVAALAVGPLVSLLIERMPSPLLVAAACAHLPESRRDSLREGGVLDDVLTRAFERQSVLAGELETNAGEPDFDAALKSLNAISAAYAAFEESFSASMEIAWRDAYEAARERSCSLFERICDACEDELQRAAPTSPTAKLGAQPQRDRAMSALRYLRASSQGAARLGFEPKRSATENALLARIVAEYPDELIEILCDDEESQRLEASDRLGFLVAFTAEVHGATVAGALQERIDYARGEGRVRARFFAHARALIKPDAAAERRSPGTVFARKEAEAIWSRAIELYGEDGLDELSRRMRMASGPTQALAVLNDVDDLRASLAPQILAELRAAQPSTGGRRVALAAVIAATPIFDLAFDQMPRRIEELQEGAIANMRRAYEALMSEFVEAGPTLLLILGARLIRPAQVMRALRRIAGQSYDYLIEGTDFSIVGDWLLDEAEAEISIFVQDGQSADVVLRAVERFAAIVAGMTDEFEIQKTGAWGKRLFAMRSRAASILERHCARAVNCVEIVTPRRGDIRSGVGGLLLDKPLEASAIRDAVDAVTFLRVTSGIDERAAFASARNKALAHIRDRLDLQADALITAAGSVEPARREAAIAQMEAIVALVAVLDGRNPASVLMRRARVAASAACR